MPNPINAITAFLCLFLYACGSPSTPEGSAEKYITLVCSGQSEKAREMVDSGLRRIYGEKTLLKLLEAEGRTCTKAGGIKKMVMKEKSDMGDTRVLMKYSITYGNGDSIAREIAMRPLDGKWLIAIH